MSELAALQRRFYALVTGALGDDPALIASGHVEIYANMYALRLYDALADDYPKLRAALGEAAFSEIARCYFKARPPRSFTLRDAGVDLPAMLRTPSWLASPPPAWASDLAALERARVEAFDGPDGVPLDHAAVVAFGEALPELILRWVPASFVVPIRYPVDDLWSAIEAETDQPVLEPLPTERVVLVWRSDHSVLHRTLDTDEARLAPSIRRGIAFAELCEILGELHGDHASARAAELLMAWLAAEVLVTSPH